jgi:hypothetical protein
VSGTLAASAQAESTFNPARANSGTLGVISGGADGTYIRIAADLANVLDGEDLRVLPMIGRGSLQNLRDIMFLRGVDIGIVQMDAREQLKAENLQNQAVNRLRFITRLYNEEVHNIASRDITDIRQLDGKKVNIDKAGSGTNLTSRLIFDKLGIKPEVTTFDQASSYAKLKSGEIQAAVYVAGRPVRAIAEFQTEGRFHLLVRRGNRRELFSGQVRECGLSAARRQHQAGRDPGRRQPARRVQLAGEFRSLQPCEAFRGCVLLPLRRIPAAGPPPEMEGGQPCGGRSRMGAHQACAGLARPRQDRQQALTPGAELRELHERPRDQRLGRAARSSVP